MALAWMDLEMTGLDPAVCSIVEIATIITDDELNVTAEGPDLVVACPPDRLAAMEDVVRKMHTKSGLLPAIEASTTTLDEATSATLEFLKEHVEAGTVPLCGNSIGTDRRFLAAFMPEVDHWLSYRSVDVSTIKELCRRWHPEEFAKAPQKQSGHRALDDIRESIEELRYYRAAVFVAPPGPDSETAKGFAAEHGGALTGAGRSTAPDPTDPGPGTA